MKPRFERETVDPILGAFDEMYVMLFCECKAREAQVPVSGRLFRNDLSQFFYCSLACG